MLRCLCVCEARKVYISRSTSYKVEQKDTLISQVDLLIKRGRTTVLESYFLEDCVLSQSDLVGAQENISTHSDLMNDSDVKQSDCHPHLMRYVNKVSRGQAL